MAAPPNEDEAKNQCTFVPNITDMHIKKYGPQIKNPPHCAELGVGALCSWYASDDKQHIFAVYCDGEGGCTRRYECPA
jgi:hypothetical protein